MINTAAQASKRLPQSCAQAALTAGGPPAIGAHVIPGGQMFITVAQPAAIEPPPEGPDHDEADLLKDTQQDKEEVQ